MINPGRGLCLQDRDQVTVDPDQNHGPETNLDAVILAGTGLLVLVAVKSPVIDVLAVFGTPGPDLLDPDPGMPAEILMDVTVISV